MTRRKLTPKQLLVLDYIESFEKNHGYGPSQKEIATHFGFSSLGTVQNYLVRLEKNGFLKKAWNEKRALKLVPKKIAAEPSLSAILRSSITTNLLRTSTDEQGYSNTSARLGSHFADGLSSIALPLTGHVAAGCPIETFEGLGKVDVPTFLLNRTPNTTQPRHGFSEKSFFVLKVVGDSMIEDGILDGDYVVIKKQKTATQGQTIVALLNHSEATIKKFFLHDDHIELVAANTKYPPIIIQKNEPFSIEGILQGVIRKCALSS